MFLYNRGRVHQEVQTGGKSPVVLHYCGAFAYEDTKKHNSGLNNDWPLSGLAVTTALPVIKYRGSVEKEKMNHCPLTPMYLMEQVRIRLSFKLFPVGSEE